MYKNLECSIAVTCFNHNWSYKHQHKGDLRLYGKLMKLSKTLLLTPKADSTNNKVKIHHEAELIQLRTEN